MNQIEETLLRRIMAPQDRAPIDVYKRASFGREEWLQALLQKQWMPAWPVLRNAGTKHQCLFPCYVLPIEDDLDYIMETLKRCAVVFRSGGSVGMNFSVLRPRGTPLSTGGEAAGPVAFMGMFDAVAGVISQSGVRRGGYMIVMDQDHEDIEEFISCKDQEGVLSNMNISVRLLDPRDEEFVKQLAEHTWKFGEPGVLYAEHLAPYECVNLCGEVPLPPWGVCNLGSVNLAQLVTDGELDWERLEQVTLQLGEYLDYLIDVNEYPFEEMEENEKKTRRIGVGVMGWHECLCELGLSYLEPVALDVASEVAQTMMKVLVDAFPNAAQHMSIAPTGTISLLCNTTPSIEPIHAPSYTVYSPQGNITVKYPITDATADQVPWRTHIDMQAAFQRHIDGAISKTVLLPHDSTPDTVAQAIRYGYQQKLKGLTLYRIGSRELEAQFTTPTVLTGKTLRTTTGTGKLFITLNFQGTRPYETFITIGRAGSLTQSFTEAIGRLISLCLQHHVPLTAIIDQLRGIRSPAPTHDKTLGAIASVPDAIAKALEYLSEEHVEDKGVVAGECPVCHAPTVMMEGCERCMQCGWSRCEG